MLRHRLLTIAITSLLVSVLARSARAEQFLMPPTYSTGGSATFVATGDFNGDGKPDLAASNYSPGSVAILLNDGNGSFGNPVNYGVSSPTAITVADLNGDGHLDLAVASYFSASVSILLGNGDGTFQPAKTYAAGNGSESLAAGDFNGDGKLDLAVANLNDNDVSILPGNGDGSFRPPVNYFVPDPACVVVGDFNRDGRLDLATVNFDYQVGQAHVLLGSGDGSFHQFAVYTIDFNPRWLATADLNGDGNLDLVTVQAGPNTVSVFAGKGDGTFGPPVDYGVELGPTFVSVGDLNGDGKLDLVVVNYSNDTVAVLAGRGDGTFQPATYYFGGSVFPSSIALADFNNDRKTDVAVSAGSITLLLGNGDATLQSLRDYNTGPGNGPVLAGDFNGDGKLDLEEQNGVLIGNGDGTFQPPINSNQGLPLGSATGDFNRDGILDVVTPSITNVGVLLGRGNGTFLPKQTYPAGRQMIATAVADFNHDGNPDVVGVGYDTSTGHCDDSGASVLLGKGDGTFQAAALYATNLCPGGVAVGDFNRDGKPDLAVSDEGISMLFGNGDGTFQAPVTVLAPPVYGPIIAADLNKDGKLDLVAGRSATGTAVTVLLGNGNGTFQPSVDYAVTSPVALAAADMNGDGKLDLLVADSAAGLSLLLGNGDGTFQAAVESALSGQVTALAVGDFNRDRATDVAVVDSFSQNLGQIGNSVLVMLNAQGAKISTISAPNPSKFGQPVTITITVSASVKGVPGIPSGAVTLMDGSNNLGTATLNTQGIATLTTSSLSRGSHVITPLYSGDGSFNSKTGKSITQVVQ